MVASRRILIPWWIGGQAGRLMILWYRYDKHGPAGPVSQTPTVEDARAARSLQSEPSLSFYAGRKS